jgi:hypothetical protein
VSALIALAVAAGFIAWLALRDGGNSSPKPPPAAQAASVDRLRRLAASLHHPIFWLGKKSGYTYELTRTQAGKVFVRYLPPGVKVGAGKPYLTVATYPFAGAFPTVRKQAEMRGAVSVKLAQGGLAVLDGRYPESVHVAYPGVNYQIEVFDPTPAAAMQTVAAGHLAVIGQLHASPSPASAAATPRAVSPAALRSLAASLGHPIYWAGPKAGYTYELTQNSAGAVFIRYLPAGVSVGEPKADYLTIATYPFPDALAAVQRVSRGDPAGTIKLPDGGLAVVDAQYPKSIHLAYPRSNFQVEVFDPSPARARQIVTSGRVSAVP